MSEPPILAPTAAGATPPAPQPKPHHPLRKWLLLLFKIAIAALGLCFVLGNFSRTQPMVGESFLTAFGFFVKPAFHWDDTAVVAAGGELRAAEFKEDMLVHVFASPIATPATKAPMVRVRFPSDPVSVEINGQVVQVVLDENTPIPGTGGVVNIPHEWDIPATLLRPVEGERIQQGVHTMLRNASGKWYLVAGAWVLLGIPFFVTAIRWRNLMRPQGIDLPLGKCLQLTFVGQFYSIMLPGVTGGDLVKIVYAARLIGSKTKSFITVVLDRVIGLVALMVIAGVSSGVQVLINWHAGTPDDTLQSVFVMIVVLLAILSVGATVYFSHRLRRLVGIEWFVDHFGADDPEEVRHEKMEHLYRVLNVILLIGAALGVGLLALLRWGLQVRWAQHNHNAVIAGIAVLGAGALGSALGLLLHARVVDRMAPALKKGVAALVHVDETLHVYRGHFGLLGWAFIISLISQLTLPLSAWMCGSALGMNAPVTHFLAYVPVAMLAASLPIGLPQGIGVLDWLLLHFFSERGSATASQAFALAQSVRFLPMIWNLFGAYWVVTGSYSRKAAVKAEERAELSGEVAP